MRTPGVTPHCEALHLNARDALRAALKDTANARSFSAVKHGQRCCWALRSLKFTGARNMRGHALDAVLSVPASTVAT